MIKQELLFLILLSGINNVIKFTICLNNNAWTSHAQFSFGWKSLTASTTNKTEIKYCTFVLVNVALSDKTFSEVFRPQINESKREQAHFANYGEVGARTIFILIKNGIFRSIIEM